MASKTWFITGTSKGFGRIWAEAALARGDSVVATARDANTLKPLADRYGERALTLALDVTDKQAVHATLAQAIEKFGRIDVLVNNAGYGVLGAVEEVNEADARAQMETNLFGALWVTQAALPQMRKQGSGHIIQVSSIGGVNAFTMVGLYHASKWALEGFSQSLAQEVAGFGIKVTLVEPGPYATDWSGPSATRAASMPEYDDVRAKRQALRANWTPGDPEATGPAILKLVDAPEPPLRCFFGSVGLELTRQEYARRMAEWEKWDYLAQEAQGHLAAKAS